ncbi:UNVERIFIED_CONTAM: hypothetical protein FKN15_071259 [Acipenser sinensis]
MVNAKLEGDPYCNRECFVCLLLLDGYHDPELSLQASTKPGQHCTCFMIDCICTTSTAALT